MLWLSGGLEFSTVDFLVNEVAVVGARIIFYVLVGLLVPFDVMCDENPFYYQVRLLNYCD